MGVAQGVCLVWKLSMRLCVLGVWVCALSFSRASDARGLTFAERVAAQESIERVYHSHQLDSVRPFERAVPRDALERKVVRYLKQSAALEKYWNTPVTAEMLERELQRMTRDTRMPDRLRELFAALDDDAVLIHECLVRAILVERLTRNFFAGDSRSHADDPQIAWELWWSKVSPGLNESAVATVASSDPRIVENLGVARFAGDACADDDIWDNRSLDDTPNARREHTAVWSGSHMLIWGGYSGPAPSNSLPLNSGARYDPATDSWESMSTVGAPSPRRYHTAVWTGSEMLIWGGDEGPDYVNTGGRYDPLTDRWTTTSTANAPSPRNYHTAIWSGSEMIVWGGRDGSDLNSGGHYDPATDSWTTTQIVGAPSPRHLHTAVWTGSEMIVWGGIGGAYLNSGARYEPATGQWTSTLVPLIVPRRRHSAVWTGSEMIVWGGRGGTPVGFDSGARYNPTTDSWAATSTVDAPVGRYDHAAVWTGSRMLIWGGDSSPAFLNSGGLYDPATNSWTATTIAGAPTPRFVHTAVWTGDRMLVWGGQVTDQNVTNTGGRYDPAADSWTATSTSTAGEPSPRSSHTAVWTGSWMLVWGGHGGGSSVVDTGGRYDPATDSWGAISTVDAPPPRFYHSAIWTGSQMLIWGGVGADYFDSGGRYDPVSDMWEATSTQGAPSPRQWHSAVWTGDRMLIWGGTDDPFFDWFNSGGRYDPETDSWTAISTVNAPSPRHLHTAVWTGNRMLVWGGHDGAVAGTGGRYDPATDSWSATSTVNAPSPRTWQKGVWTGSEMLIWGGTGGGFQNTGGRYDPIADSWTPTSTVGAPPPSGLLTLVWNGKEMLSWGGLDQDAGGFGYFDSGGRYDPATDSWLATSMVGAPSPRALHTAVWTGDEMLVWGGTSGTPLSSGGRYLLSPDDDSDGVSVCAGDCDDADDQLWATPGEVINVAFSTDRESLHWSAPLSPGAVSLQYDVLVSGESADFGESSGTQCVDRIDVTGTQATVADTPPSAVVHYYLVRALNGCANGSGTLGSGNPGPERVGVDCP